MSRFETVVYGLVVSLLFGFHSAFAAESGTNTTTNVTNTNPVSPKECLAVAKELAALTYKAGTEKYKTDVNKKYDECRAGGEAKGCEKSLKEYTEAKNSFVTACSQAQMPGGGNAGSIACSAHLEKCLDAGKIEGQLDEDSSASYDVEQLKEQKDKCPSFANSSIDPKELKAEMKEAKEEAKELKDRVKELSDTQVEAQNSAGDKQLEIQQQVQEAQKQCKQEQKDLERGLKDKKKEIQDQVAQMNSQILQLNDQIGQSENTLLQAAVETNKQKIEIDMQCYGIALQKVNERRKQILEKVMANAYNMGDMNKVFGFTGKTTRKADQELADVEYRNCKNGADTAAKLEMVAKNHQMTEAMVAKQVASYKAQRDKVQTEIGVLLNNETARADSETQQDVADAKQACSQNLALMNQRLWQENMKSMQAQAKAASDMADATNDLKIAEQNQRDIASVARQANRGNTDSKAFADVLSKGTTFQSAAESFRLSCCGDVKGMEGTCNEASNYLTSLGVTVSSVAATEPQVTPTPTSGEAAPASAAVPVSDKTNKPSGKGKNAGKRQPAKAATKPVPQLSDDTKKRMREKGIGNR